jgi:hypothetical protein
MTKYSMLLAGLLLFAAGCNRGDDEKTATLSVTPRHHGRAIDSCMVYIKYNATDIPANGIFDDSAKCVPVGGIPVATFSGLKGGNHYLYGFGWDPQLTPPQVVRGGFALPFSAESDQAIDLAVSED